MLVIDVHAHLVPQSFPELPAGVPAHEWPVMVPLDDGRARMLIDGKEFRVFDSAYWDVPGRIAYMDAEGIALQVLSPLPELLGYWFDARTTVAVAEHVHHTIATAIASAPTRLAGMGMLPLQDVAASVEIIPRIAALGLRGVLVASNVNGVSIADARFYPVFAALEQQGLALFVHGYRPAGVERFIGSPLMAPVIGVPQEGAAALASFIITDIFGHFPKLKLGFVHGGGSFGAVLGRMDHVWEEFAEMRQTLKTAPRDYVKKFFFDTVTFSPAYLRFLIEQYGAPSLMAGSDGPTPIGQRGLAAFVAKATDGDAGATEQILWKNAVRFLALDDIVTQQMALAS
jgi:aminocarboxymuconate-semialdehyde decarboxylase